MDWRPIETAPKDGEEVLLVLPSWGVRIGSWSAHGDRSYPFVWKNQTGDVLVRPWHDDEEPTHWMPVPKAPV